MNDSSSHAMPGNSPSGTPVAPIQTRSPLARSSSVSVCPPLTYRHSPLAGYASTSAAVAYLLPGVVANSSSLVRHASSASEASRPSRARNVAWIVLMSSDAARPLPDTSATQNRQASSPPSVSVSTS